MAERNLRQNPTLLSNDVGEARLRHGLTGGQKLGGHWDINIAASLDPLNLDAPFTVRAGPVEVLRAEAHDFPFSGCGLEAEFQDEPRLGSERPVGSVLLDFGICPGVMSVGLGCVTLSPAVASALSMEGTPDFINPRMLRSQ